jgi:hypothetical protein
LLSPETFLALGGGLFTAFLALRDEPAAWLQVLATSIVLVPAMRGFFYVVYGSEKSRLSSTRSGVMQSHYARSRGATLRKTFLASVIDVPIPNVGVARVRFFAGRTSSWMRLRLESPALARAPWVCLQGAGLFLLPTRAVGAKALAVSERNHRWRYWRPPWRLADPIIESHDFGASLPRSLTALVLTSRPGHLLIRGEVFEHIVDLAIAWVQAVRQTAGAPLPEGTSRD